MPTISTRTKALVAISAFVLSLSALVYWAELVGDSHYRVEVVDNAPLYSLPPHEYPSTNPKVRELKQGEQVRVLRVRYGKDFEALKVETSAGQVGWVVGGEGVKVVSRGE